VRLGVLDSIGMAISGAVAVAGVFILSKYHPDAQVDPPSAAVRAAEAAAASETAVEEELERN
jgi:hypothetical protein